MKEQYFDTDLLEIQPIVEHKRKKTNKERCAELFSEIINLEEKLYERRTKKSI